MDVRHYKELDALNKYVTMMTGKKIPVSFGARTETNGKSIFLTPDARPFSKESALLYFGGVNHECDHITEGTDIERFMLELGKEKHGRILQGLVNIIEDVRVEISKDRKYPKMPVMRRQYVSLKKDKIFESFKDVKKTSGLTAILHVCGCMVIMKARFPMLGLKDDIIVHPEIQTIYDKYFKRYQKLVVKLDTYMDAENLARKILEGLKDLIRDELIKQQQQKEKNHEPPSYSDDKGDAGSDERGDEDAREDQSNTGRGDTKPEDDQPKDSGESGDDDSDAQGCTGDDDPQKPSGDESDGKGDGVDENQGLNNPDDTTGDDKSTEGNQQPGSDQDDPSDTDGDQTLGNEDGKDESCTGDSNDADDSTEPGDDSGKHGSSGSNNSREEGAGDEGVSGKVNEEDEATEPPSSKADEDGETSPSDQGPQVDEGEVDRYLSTIATDQLLSDEEMIKKAMTNNFSNSGIYLKDPGVRDQIVDAEEGSGGTAQIYKQEGIKLVGHVGAEVCRMFIQATKPRVVRRQFKGRFDTRQFENTPYADDVYAQRFPGALEMAALAIGLDNSGSMDGYKSVIASRLLSGLLYHTDQNNIPTEVAGYTIMNSVYGAMRKEPVRIEVIKRYEEKYDAHVMRRCIPTSYRGETPDMDVLTEFLIPRLMLRPEKKKVVFMICDGQPTNLCGCLQSSYKKYLQSLKEEGFILWGFGINSNLSEYFKDDWSYVSSGTLADTVINQLRKILMAERK